MIGWSVPWAFHHSTLAGTLRSYWLCWNSRQIPHNPTRILAKISRHLNELLFRWQALVSVENIPTVHSRPEPSRRKFHSREAKMNRTTLLFAATLIAVLAVIATPDKAQAQYGNWGGSIVPYPYATGYFSSPYSLGQVPTPPYFALHPPVYYSRPVARSYGYSPYVYPGTTMTPEVVEEIIGPEIIENPYCSPTSTGKPLKEDPSVKSASVRPTWIINPYVQAKSEQVVTTVATRE